MRFAGCALFYYTKEIGNGKSFVFGPSTFRRSCDTQYKRRKQGRKHMLRTIAARQRTALTVHSIQLFVCCFFLFIFFVECLYRVVRMHDFNFERDICSN